jgi:hypothetical protein
VIDGHDNSVYTNVEHLNERGIDVGHNNG